MTDARVYPSRPFCGVGVVVWNDGKVLLVRRAKPPRQGQWALPGGVQELGETLFEAAQREVREETGIEIEPERMVTALDLIERDAIGIVFHYTIVEISSRYVAGELFPHDDALAAEWFDPDDIASLDASDRVGHVVAMARI